jgi:hypothetical protein
MSEEGKGGKEERNLHEAGFDLIYPIGTGKTTTLEGVVGCMGFQFFSQGTLTLVILLKEYP